MPPPDLGLLTRDPITQRVDRDASSPEYQAAGCATLRHQMVVRDRYGKSPVSLRAGLLDERGSRLDRAMPFILFFGLFNVLGMAGSGSGATCAVFGVLGLAGVIALGTLGIARTQRYRTDTSRTRVGRCAACGFDLSGLEQPIAPSRLAGRRLGPARCPACGLTWPLLARLRGE